MNFPPCLVQSLCSYNKHLISFSVTTFHSLCTSLSLTASYFHFNYVRVLDKSLHDLKMAMTIFVFISTLLGSLFAVALGTPVSPFAQPTCTTMTIVPPEVQLGPTFTHFLSTATATLSLDCAGCSLFVKSKFPEVGIVSLLEGLLSCVEASLISLCRCPYGRLSLLRLPRLRLTLVAPL